MAKLKIATAVDLQSPIAAAYAPIDNCDVCNAPLRRWEIMQHGRACRVIEMMLASGHKDRPVELPVEVGVSDDAITQARRRRGI